MEEAEGEERATEGNAPIKTCKNTAECPNKWYKYPESGNIGIWFSCLK